MEFVASMTSRIDELRQLWHLWQTYNDGRNPFARTIFTPLFARANVLKFMHTRLAPQGGVMFDSGGYYVQQGVVSYEALYQRLLEFYRHNQWANWYVLPDYVPTSSLSPAEVESRIQATITVTRQFALEMPAELRPLILPVVQGHTREQIKLCVESYAAMGATYIGFGSFGTSGDNNAINTITRQAIHMIEFLKLHAQQYDLKIHLFGVGTPNVLSLFYDLGIDSFDSSCWSRTAGYGNVYLPFIGRRSITQRMAREIGGVAYKASEFNELKAATEHDCPFCRDFETLKTSRITQMAHNLYVMMDTVDALNAGKKLIPELIGVDKSRYTHYRKQPNVKFRSESE